jgi:hypothetical protein
MTSTTNEQILNENGERMGEMCNETRGDSEITDTDDDNEGISKTSKRKTKKHRRLTPETRNEGKIV